MEIFIYVITNLINGMRYVGQTNNMKKRWYAHYNESSGCRLLRDAIQTFGKDNFTMVKIASAFDPAEATRLEDGYIAAYDLINPEKGYNLATNSHGVSEETRQKLSESHLGYKHTDEAKAKIGAAHAGALNPNFGKPLPQEQRDKIRVSMIGDKNHFYGKTHTDKAKAKISENAIGREFSAEHRAKISEANTGEKNGMYGRTGKLAPSFGREVSPEIRAKISEAVAGEKNGMYGKRHTEEAKAQMSEFRKGKQTGKDNPMYGRTGEKNPASKLSDAQRIEIRALHPRLSYSELAKKFGMSKTQIGRIVRGTND